jgi:protein SCO1/2
MNRPIETHSTVGIRESRAAILIFLAGLLLIRPASAQTPPQQQLPPLVRDIGIDQHLNDQLPLDLMFRDESGNTIRLRDYFGKRPVILTFAYYQCPMLCTLVLNGLLKAMRAMSLELGKDFEVVNISINPRETFTLAAGKKNTYVKEYGRPGAELGWHFLVGDEANIRQATEAAGYRYRYDEAYGQYAHASGIMILTPDGKFSKYFYGLEYSARDLRLGLVEAAAGQIGSPVDQILLFCYHYDPISGKYGLLVTKVVQVMGTTTILVLGAFIFVMLRRDRRARAAAK